MVNLQNLQTKIRLPQKKLKAIVDQTCQQLNVEVSELTIIFITSQRMVALNKRFKGRAYTTDVLAFDQRDDLRQPLFGDIFVCTDVAIKQAREYNTTPMSEIILYIIHGILHFAGYDDRTESKRKKMWKKQEELMEKIALT